MHKKYSITKGNAHVHELIGLNAEVVKSTDPARTNVRGKIVDETKNTFKIETANGEKILPKNEVLLSFEVEDGKVELDGKFLAVRPEDRIKKLWRKEYGRMQ